MAVAPKNMIEVRFTKMYRNNQKMVITKLTDSLYLVFRNCGMVKILFFRYTGINQMAIMMSEIAANHSYAATAIPTKNPFPLMPINCSAEILDAIKEAPMAHQVSDPSAKKKSLVSIEPFFLRW
jgi:hypothetical protein